MLDPSINPLATGIPQRLLGCGVCSKGQHLTHTLNQKVQNKHQKADCNSGSLPNPLIPKVGYSPHEPNCPTSRIASYRDMIFVQTSGEPSLAFHPVCLLPRYFGYYFWADNSLADISASISSMVGKLPLNFSGIKVVMSYWEIPIG